jgi:hypothetical protein
MFWVIFGEEKAIGIAMEILPMADAGSFERIGKIVMKSPGPAAMDVRVSRVLPK